MDQQTTQYVGVAVGLALGAVQKHLLPKLPNWCIPIVNTTLGVVAGHFIPELGIGGGALAGAASVGTHQMLKQPAERIAGRKL